MQYYQYDAILNTDPRIEHVSYVLKTPTPLSSKEIEEVEVFQRNFIKTQLKFLCVVSDKLTAISEADIERHMERRNMPMESIIYMEQQNMA